MRIFYTVDNNRNFSKRFKWKPYFWWHQYNFVIIFSNTLPSLNSSNLAFLNPSDFHSLLVICFPYFLAKSLTSLPSIVSYPPSIYSLTLTSGIDLFIFIASLYLPILANKRCTSGSFTYLVASLSSWYCIKAGRDFNLSFYNLLLTALARFFLHRQVYNNDLLIHLHEDIFHV